MEIKAEKSKLSILKWLFGLLSDSSACFNNKQTRFSFFFILIYIHFICRSSIFRYFDFITLYSFIDMMIMTYINEITNVEKLPENNGKNPQEKPHKIFLLFIFIFFSVFFDSLVRIKFFGCLFFVFRLVWSVASLNYIVSGFDKKKIHHRFRCNRSHTMATSNSRGRK